MNNEIVGILPVLVTPVNAMYYQGILRGDISGDYITDRIDSFCPVSRIHTTPTVGFTKSGESMGEFYDKCFTDGVDGDTKYDTPDEEFNGFLVPIGTESDERWCLENINSQSLSKMASDMFPTIRQNEDDYDSRYLKDVGLVVFRMFFDRSNDNKISFIPAESFIGSLDPEHVDPITGASDFIDTVVNDNSEYVYIFSNIDIEKRGEPLKDFTKSQTLYIGNQHAISLGFHQSDSKKTISYKNSILDPIQRIFDNHQDYTNLDIDIMIDAGMSTIAQSIVNSARTLSGDAYPETAVFFEVEDGKNPIMSSTELGAWRSVVMKYDNFCKYVRKDCIYLCDSPRAMVLEGP